LTGPQPAKNLGEQSHFWQWLWHWCAVNHDATFLVWSATNVGGGSLL